MLYAAIHGEYNGVMIVAIFHQFLTPDTFTFCRRVAELGIYLVIFAYCGTLVSKNVKITREISSGPALSWPDIWSQSRMLVSKSPCQI